jgi:hypothetical protein
MCRCPAHTGKRNQYGEIDMASIRIETVADEASRQVYAEVFSGDDLKPVLRSDAAFASHEDAIEQVLNMCRTHFPDHNPFADDPTIGV